MRLTDQQRSIIRTTVAETFGTGAKVWPFGSRVDEGKRVAQELKDSQPMFELGKTLPAAFPE